MSLVINFIIVIDPLAQSRSGINTQVYKVLWDAVEVPIFCPRHAMSSENFTLPPFANLCESLNVPPPSQRQGVPVQPNMGPIPPFYTSAPEINIGSDGYEVVQGPLNHDQRWMLQGRSSFPSEVLMNVPSGSHYIMLKGHGPTSYCEPVRSSDKCYVPSTQQLGGYCFILQQQRTFVQQLNIRPYKAHGNGFIVYLHRPLGDQRSTIRVRGAIPFISTDTMDRALGLPGVSIGRLLCQEPDILVNANSVIQPPELKGSEFAIRVEISAAGYNGVVKKFLLMECTHGWMTHLGLARQVAYGFIQLLAKSPQRTHFNATNLRLVALYKLEDSKDNVWNVAYAVVNP
ncbi:hypothetical protein ARMSODRAFT_1027542 [Armillaria solidipes]|uniref:Uncharacterized protein n=1 Tax=Armillaria solidipes TaxID=1076256 RepID=A0A2H3AK33_9AGAR|nr:hypothetical protein ARMSODRAFT_1027542 [Armillaria solidipes]